MRRSHKFFLPEVLISLRKGRRGDVHALARDGMMRAHALHSGFTGAVRDPLPPNERGDAPSPVGPGAGGARITAAARADGPRLPRSAPRILVIEGNINAGKTTVVDILEGLGCPVVREGVDVWGDILTAFYDNNIPLSQTSWT